MKENNALRYAAELLPGEVKRSIYMLKSDMRGGIREILLRTGKPVVIVCETGRFFLGNYGRAGRLYSPDSIVMSEDMMTRTFMNMCKDSVYSYMDNINSGYLTLPGGNRVGVCGRFVSVSPEMKSVRNISSLSVRIASEHIGVASKIISLYFRRGLDNTLIVGPPCSGKTTLLRDVCRSLSEDYKISLIDERSEISGEFDVGINTDVYLNYNKQEAIEMSVRTMSPEIIIFDEIGNKEIETVGQCMNSGVKFIFSMHAEDFEELSSKPQFEKLKQAAYIKYLVFLKRDYPGKISEVYIRDENGCYIDNSRDLGLHRIEQAGKAISESSFAFGNEAIAS